MGQNPFSAMMTKYVKKPAVACIIPDEEGEEEECEVAASAAVSH